MTNKTYEKLKENLKLKSFFHIKDKYVTSEKSAEDEEKEHYLLDDYDDSDNQIKKKYKIKNRCKTYDFGNHCTMSEWMGVLSCTVIPIIGWIYLLILIFKKPKTAADYDKKQFAKAKIIQRLTSYILIIITLYIIYLISLPYIEKLLDYMEML